MRKSAWFLLAVISIFPLLVFGASPPGDEPAAGSDGTATRVVTGGPTIKLFGAKLPEELQLPVELQSLPSKERAAVLGQHLQPTYLRYRAPRTERPGAICLAGDADDLCAAAARISYSRPCLAAADCPAVEEWETVMGEMGVRPAPRSMVRAADRSRREPPEEN